MAFEKGKSGNPNGRPKGTTNKITNEMREALSMVLFEEIEKIPTYIQQVNSPYNKVELLIKLLPYVVPKVESVPYHEYHSDKPGFEFDWFK